MVPARPVGSPRVPAYDMAREAAIEKAKSSYIELVCGHLTTWEADEAYSQWRPKRGLHFCETCGAWHSRLQKAKPNPMPGVPMF